VILRTAQLWCVFHHGYTPKLWATKTWVLYYEANLQYIHCEVRAGGFGRVAHVSQVGRSNHTTPPLSITHTQSHDTQDGPPFSTPELGLSLRLDYCMTRRPL
jgi:hypothetical protein